VDAVVSEQSKGVFVVTAEADLFFDIAPNGLESRRTDDSA
jgi:hypothetical protein